VDIDEAAASATVDAITTAGGRATAVTGDVTSRASMDAAVIEGIAAFGQIDICVCNAGVIGGAGFTERKNYNETDWDATNAVNLRGAVNTVEAVQDHMIERGNGRVVNISSHGGRTPRGANPSLGNILTPYGVSKAGVLQWTWNLALQLARYNITVNAVCPGTLWTPMWERIAIMRQATDSTLAGLTPKQIFDRQIGVTMPLGRPQTPEDIGDCVAFLSSDDARIITGQALNVNGGAVMN
jgi:NAD(P)-dependent dehydrogenase (short-subunit alcohol dehydrogenase family)